MPLFAFKFALLLLHYYMCLILFSMNYSKSLLLVAFIMITNSLYSQNFLSKFNSVGEICSVGGNTFFAADDGKNGMELWKTDGTIAGTIMIKDINAGYISSDPANLTAFNNELYFSANDGIYGIELWKSDGTPGGTVLLKNIKPESFQDGNSSTPSNFRVFNNALYFTAADEWDRVDIWKTDGTENGTVKFYENEFASIGQFTVMNNAIFFIRYFGPNQLFVTDGTQGGTHQIPVDDYYSIEELTTVNNKLFFITSTSYRQQFRLYTLNPDDETLIRLRDYNSALYGSNNIVNMTAVNDDLYYSIQTDNNTNYYSDVLWKSNGTVSGTDTVKSFTYDPHLYGSNMTDFINYNNKLYFRGKFSGKYTFCESDGTYQGTKEVKNINLYSKGLNFTICNNLLYFTGYINSNTNSVWKSDGSSLGTTACEAINAGIGQVSVRLFNGKGELYYITYDGSYSSVLWNNTAKPEIQIFNGYYSVESGQQISFNANTANPIVTLPLKIKNTGTADLFISGAQIDGGNFYINELDRVIPSNESRILNVTFYPAKAGSQAGKLKIYSNDETESCFWINLNGTSIIDNSTSGLLDENLSLNQSTGLSSDTDAISLSNSLIAENQPSNSIIGSLKVRYANSSGFVYSLVTGQGDEDNNLFYLVNNTFYSNKVFDFETQNTYVIRVKATNNSENIEDFLMIRVTDINEPSTGKCPRQVYNMSFALNDVDFVTDNIVFAVGDNGVILKSEDWGNNWSSINSGTQNNLNHIKFVSEQVGYILGAYNNVFLKTENGGTNWLPLDLPDLTYPYASNSFFVNEQTGIVIGGDGKILKTTDGGRNWTTKDGGSGNFKSVFFLNEQVGFICGQSNKLIKTIDGGENWTNINMDAAGYNVSFNDIWFTNELTGYLLAENGQLYKSSDGGESWTLNFNSGQEFMTHVYFVDENVGYMIGSWNYTVIFKTMDAGATWTADNSNYSRGSLSGISMNKSGTKGCITGNGAGFGSTSQPGQILYRTDDSGYSWQNQSMLIGDDDFREVKFFNNLIGYIIDDYGSVVKTHDGGYTWQQMNNHTDGTFLECHYISVDTIFMVTTTEVRCTFNGGLSWNTVPGFPGWANYCFLDYNHIFYGKDDRIFRSDNAGQTWTQVYKDNEFFWFSKISYYNNNTIIALGLDAIATSKDGGSTWSKSKFDNIVFLESIYFKDGNNIQVGGQKGVFLKSVDGGISWARCYTSISTDIKQIYFFDTMNGIALASNGSYTTLYSTSDGGNTWLPGNSVSEDCRGFSVGNNDDIYISGSRGYLVRYSKSIGLSAAGYISGDAVVCNDTRSEYHATSLPYGEYIWEVIPNQEINYTNNNATVNWSQPGTYQVKATPENGCGTGLSRIMDVLVQEMPEASISGNDSVYPHENGVVYMSNSGANLQVNWQVQGADSMTLLNENEILVNWGSIPSGRVNLIHTSTETGCRQMASYVYILSVTNINDMLKQLDVEVYPNPTSAKVFVKVDRQGLKLTISLYNERGEQLIVNKTECKSLTEINMEGLSSGVYILKVSSGTINASTKIIKL